MLDKGKKRKSISYGKEIKYLNNTAINDYVLGNNIMYSCLEPIKNILKNEHCSKKEYSLFKNELALNLDKVEEVIKKGTSQRKPTVDFVVGLGNSQLLLTEAKILSNNMENIANDINKKIKHSKELLTNNPKFTSIYNKIVILLSPKNFEQKKNKLMSLLKNDISSFYPSTSTDFYSKFF